MLQPPYTPATFSEIGKGSTLRFHYSALPPFVMCEVLETKEIIDSVAIRIKANLYVHKHKHTYQKGHEFTCHISELEIPPN